MDFQKSTPICNSEDRNKPTPNLTARPTRLCTQTGHRLNRHAGPAAHLGPSVIERERAGLVFPLSSSLGHRE
jgi:hypothetical protein